VGLVFASRRTAIEATEVVNLLRRDGYRGLAGPEELQKGDIVVYRSAASSRLSHVGVVWRIDNELDLCHRAVYVLSKWGDGGEYEHLIEQVPALQGIPSEYWTDRA
jgi:Txe/YoeB family toxin of Txe-Axe toxin-antitoxin module